MKIDWNKVPALFKYAAQDRSGEIYFYEYEPAIKSPDSLGWTWSKGRYQFYKRSRGNPRWQKTLINRPEV